MPQLGQQATARIELENITPIKQSYTVQLIIGEQIAAKSSHIDVTVPSNDSVSLDIPVTMPMTAGKFKTFLDVYYGNTPVTQFAFDSIDVGDPNDPNDPENPNYDNIPDAEDSEYGDYIEFSNFDPDHYPQTGEVFEIRIDSSWPIPDPSETPDPVKYLLKVTGAVDVEKEIVIQPRVTETHTISTECDFEGPNEISCEGFTAEVIGEATYDIDPPSGSPVLPSYVWCPFCKEKFYDRDYTEYTNQVYAAAMTHMLTTHGYPRDQYDTTGSGGESIPAHLTGDDGYVVSRLREAALDVIQNTKIGDPAWDEDNLENLRDKFEQDLDYLISLLNESSEDASPPPEELSCSDLKSSTLIKEIPDRCTNSVEAYMNVNDMLPYMGVSTLTNLIYKAKIGVTDYKYLTLGDVAPGYYYGWETGWDEEEIPEEGVIEELPYKVFIDSIPSANQVVPWAGGSTVLGVLQGWGSSPDDVYSVWTTPDGGEGAGHYEMIEGDTGVAFIDTRKPSDTSIYDYEFVSDRNNYWFKYVSEVDKYARVRSDGEPYNNDL